MFLRVSPKVYRGPQPYFEDLERLQAQGLALVVNLRAESTDSEIFCRQLGIDYRHIPVEDWGVPEELQVHEFLSLTQAAPAPKTLVHCFQGIGRTGIFVTCYRVRLGMDLEEAIETSDQETPGVVMSGQQRDWLRAFAPRFRQ